MIGSYIDESFDMRQSGMFVVGGLMGRGPAIFELDRRWESLRKRADIDIQYFKASQCERGTKQFSKFVADPDDIQPTERDRLDSISFEFLNAIVNPQFVEKNIILFGVGIAQDDFYSLIQDANARAILGTSPYRLAYDLAIIACAAAMKKIGTGDRVSFVCDENEQYSPLAQEAYASLKSTNPQAEAYMASYSSVDEKDCAPVQAADAVVYEIRRYLQISLGQRPGILRKQFRTLQSDVAIVVNATKENLLNIVGRCNPGEPFSLDIIMDLGFLEHELPITL